MQSTKLPTIAFAAALTTMLATACGSSQNTQNTQGNVTEGKGYHFKRIDGSTTQPAQRATRTLHFSTTGTPVTDNTVEETRAASQQSGTATVTVESKKSTKSTK